MPPRRVGGQPFHPIWGILCGRFFLRRVDPHRRRQICRLWLSLHEALGMPRIGRRQHLLPLRPHRRGLAEVDDRGCEEAEAAVLMVVVVPAEKLLPKGAAIGD